MNDYLTPSNPPRFDYSNLSGRATTRYMRLARRLFAGVDEVERQIAPYAAAWHELNAAALRSSDPLWVALGDSITQGVGASSVEQGWVLQTHQALRRRGINYRVINLSVSGATVLDVVRTQITAMRKLRDLPAVVTLLVGSNDVVHRNLRRTLLTHYQELI